MLHLRIALLVLAVRGSLAYARPTDVPPPDIALAESPLKALHGRVLLRLPVASEVSKDYVGDSRSDFLVKNGSRVLRLSVTDLYENSAKPLKETKRLVLERIGTAYGLRVNSKSLLGLSPDVMLIALEANPKSSDKPFAVAMVRSPSGAMYAVEFFAEGLGGASYWLGLARRIANAMRAVDAVAETVSVIGAGELSATLTTGSSWRTTLTSLDPKVTYELRRVEKFGEIANSCEISVGTSSVSEATQQPGSIVETTIDGKRYNWTLTRTKARVLQHIDIHLSNGVAMSAACISNEDVATDIRTIFETLHVGGIKP